MVQHFILKGYSFILGTSRRRKASQLSYGTARCTQQVSKAKERKKQPKNIWAGPLQLTGRQRLSGSFTFVFKMSHRSQKSQRDQPSPTLLEGTHDRTQNKLNPLLLKFRQTYLRIFLRVSSFTQDTPPSLRYPKPFPSPALYFFFFAS